MTDAPQTAPADAEAVPAPTLDGLVDDAKGSPQGIAALAYGYAQGLSGEAGRRVAGVVVVSVDTEAEAGAPLQSHMVVSVDPVSMARILRAQADALAIEADATLQTPPAGDPDGAESPWEPTA